MKRKHLFEGPLFEAEDRLQTFAHSLYAAYALSETMEEFAKLKSEYATALSASVDDSLLNAKRSELEYIERMIELTAYGISGVVGESDNVHD